eukprot:TRINITY_DN109659_c0_g1_i1.p1 TRINITY_DN109659_c0_g1~~TRINITY_DN109659_c0_g1_i1.p1  ORF type:complete len:723 (-),score=126.40 TRINITY_DN109659_c0_g1_i1:27-2114(-)
MSRSGNAARHAGLPRSWNASKERSKFAKLAEMRLTACLHLLCWLAACKRGGHSFDDSDDDASQGVPDGASDSLQSSEEVTSLPGAFGAPCRSAAPETDASPQEVTPPPSVTELSPIFAALTKEDHAEADDSSTHVSETDAIGHHAQQRQRHEACKKRRWTREHKCLSIPEFEQVRAELEAVRQAVQELPGGLVRSRVSEALDVIVAETCPGSSAEKASGSRRWARKRRCPVGGSRRSRTSPKHAVHAGQQNLSPLPPLQPADEDENENKAWSLRNAAAVVEEQDQLRKLPDVEEHVPVLETPVAGGDLPASPMGSAESSFVASLAPESVAEANLTAAASSYEFEAPALDPATPAPKSAQASSETPPPVSKDPKGVACCDGSPASLEHSKDHDSQLRRGLLLPPPPETNQQLPSQPHVNTSSPTTTSSVPTGTMPPLGVMEEAPSRSITLDSGAVVLKAPGSVSAKPEKTTAAADTSAASEEASTVRASMGGKVKTPTPESSRPPSVPALSLREAQRFLPPPPAASARLRRHEKGKRMSSGPLEAKLLMSRGAPRSSRRPASVPALNLQEVQRLPPAPDGQHLPPAPATERAPRLPRPPPETDRAPHLPRSSCCWNGSCATERHPRTRTYRGLTSGYSLASDAGLREPQERHPWDTDLFTLGKVWKAAEQASSSGPSHAKHAGQRDARGRQCPATP